MWQDHHILITGAGRRVGRELAEFFWNLGAQITSSYLTTVPNDRAPRERFLPIQADLTRPAETRKMLECAVARFGPLSCLIHSASSFLPNEVGDEFFDWDRVSDIHLRAGFVLAQEFDKHARPGGTLVFIVDTYAERGLEHFGAYCAAKSGLLGLIQFLAKQWAPRLRVNGISPGPILFPDGYTEQQQARILAHVPLGQGSPGDVAHAVAFVITNKYITGQCIRVDGGLNLY